MISIDESDDVHVKNQETGSEVIFTGRDDVDKVWSNIVSAIDTEPLKSKLATKKNTLQYLDARFGNKVFYKFTNGNEGDLIQSPHETTPAVETPFR